MTYVLIGSSFVLSVEMLYLVYRDANRVSIAAIAAMLLVNFRLIDSDSGDTPLTIAWALASAAVGAVAAVLFCRRRRGAVADENRSS